MVSRSILFRSIIFGLLISFGAAYSSARTVVVTTPATHVQKAAAEPIVPFPTHGMAAAEPIVPFPTHGSGLVG